jgi:hypothetical protein
VNVSTVQSGLDDLPPKIRDQLTDRSVNVRIERSGDNPLVVGLELEGETVQEVGPPQEDPDLVVKPNDRTVQAIRDSLSPK